MCEDITKHTANAACRNNGSSEVDFDRRSKDQSKYQRGDRHAVKLHEVSDDTCKQCPDDVKCHVVDRIAADDRDYYDQGKEDISGDLHQFREDSDTHHTKDQKENIC